MNQTLCQKRYGVYAAKGGETTKKAIPFFVIIATVLCCAPQAPIVVEKAKVAPSSEIGRDGHFILYSNGVVKDTKTGLEWVAGPDRDTTWDDAHSWVESLTVDGGGWRMPTLEELKSLYQEGTGKRNMTQLLKITGWYVWSGRQWIRRRPGPSASATAPGTSTTSAPPTLATAGRLRCVPVDDLATILQMQQGAEREGGYP